MEEIVGVSTNDRNQPDPDDQQNHCHLGVSDKKQWEQGMGCQGYLFPDRKPAVQVRCHQHVCFSASHPSCSLQVKRSVGFFVP